ncbi:MAG: hypothetical protein KC457_23775, partial [Myxococcales bacterium]|nr:hypothetical protein [Myxococcales bacterium]
IVHQHEEAARVAARLVEVGDKTDRAAMERLTSRAQRLRSLARPRSTLDFDLGKPLDSRWRLTQPGVIRSESRGLRVDIINVPGPVLQRPFYWDGERLELELELELERLEWGAMLNVDLVAIDEAGAAEATLGHLRIGAIGGGGHYVLERAEGRTLVPGSVVETPRMIAARPAEDQQRLRMRLDVSADTSTAWVSVTSSGEGHEPTTLAYTLGFEPAARRPGRYELRISTGRDPWMRGVVLLEHLALVGAGEDLEARTATPREQVLLALANAEHAHALALLEAAPAEAFAPRDRQWLMALALEQLGRWPEAQLQIQGAMGACDDDEALARFAYAMLLVPDRFGPTLREHCSRERFLFDTWQVAWGALFHHPDLTDVHRTMTTQLVDLDHCRPRDFVQAQACADLLTARSRGWYMQNLGAAADSDLRQAIAMVDVWMSRPQLTPEQAQTLRRTGSLAHVRLAAVLVSRNSLAEAELELRTALAMDDAPEIIADVIVSRSLFAPLHERPIWAEVVAAQSGRGLTIFQPPR